MTTLVALAILAGGTMTAEAAEPRDSPVLADFSEMEGIVAAKEPKESLLPKVIEAVQPLCGSEAPQDFRSYRGVFFDDYKGDLVLAKCGSRPFGATHVFAIANGPTVVATGETWPSTEVKVVDDLDGDKHDEVILMHTERPIIKQHARVVSYKSGQEELIQDFGLVYTGSDPAFTGQCRERAAVIFMHTYDPSAMKRKDYGQPCGADKEWSEIGDAELVGPG